MSRIDEALRRVQNDAENERRQASTPGQQLFTPVWPVEGEPSPAADAGSPRSGLQRDVRQAGSSQALITFSSTWHERLAGGQNGDPGLIEQFRKLAGILHHAQQVNGLRSVMVTSASPGDGKTLTAVNLALVLAESYRYNVLLVDADLRRPSIPRLEDVAEGSGLGEVLRAPKEQKLALVPITPGLTLLPAGQPVANSLEALTSPRMHQILEEASSRFDWVVLDAPPVGLTADASLLTQMVGGTIFVVRAGKSQYPEVQKAMDSLGRDRIMGVVLNGVDHRPSEGYYYGVGRDDAGG